jgi:HSP20 family protein
MQFNPNQEGYMATQVAQSSKGKRQQQPSERSPLAEMARWQQQMERRFADLFSGRITRLWDESAESEITEPAIDLYEEGDEVVVKAEMPGMTKDNIHISFADNVLTIRGEKKKEEEDQGKDYYRAERVYGAFVRSIVLPAEVYPEKASALFKNGVLEIRLPKSEAAKKKEIKVNVQ